MLDELLGGVEVGLFVSALIDGEALADPRVRPVPFSGPAGLLTGLPRPLTPGAFAVGVTVGLLLKRLLALLGLGTALPPPGEASELLVFLPSWWARWRASAAAVVSWAACCSALCTSRACWWG